VSDEARLEAMFAREALSALEALIAERIEAAFAARAHSNGTPWLSLRDAAEYLAVSERTLERAIAKGRLRSSALGRRRILHRDDLDAYARAAGEE
jgi:excisionase family DNA binding protein